MGFGSYVAACAEVSVSADGKLKIHRIVAATDCGHAVNPQQIEAQVEGSFVYGLSAALYGECTVKDGRIEQTNFDTYPVLRMDEMPKVETIVMPSGGFWGGVGEPTIAVAAPAVLNAIFAATGKRIRELPLKQPQPEEGLMRRSRLRRPALGSRCGRAWRRRRRLALQVVGDAHPASRSPRSRRRRRAAAPSSPTGSRACACCATPGRSPKSASRATSRPTWPAPARAGGEASCACASSMRGA